MNPFTNSATVSSSNNTQMAQQAKMSNPFASAANTQAANFNNNHPSAASAEQAHALMGTPESVGSANGGSYPQ